MPLYDALGKKVSKAQPGPTPPSRTKNFPNVPTIDDLRAGLLNAQDNLRQPVILTWRRDQNGPMFLLTVIRNSEAYEPTWILNTDDTNSITVHWSYNTADPELIHGLITEKLLESGPAAVIPDTLRPKGQRISNSRTPSSLQPAANVGEPQFFENYEILNTIGRGGMGIIYKAKDRNDGSLVALKVLKTELMVEKSNVERFKREASAVHSLKHPNLVSLREFGFSRFGQPFITMDYLEGVELKTVLSEHEQLELPVFINIFTQLCNALAYAHEKSLVHRDLKPGNIMLVKSDGGQDVVKLIDFGIAKSVSEESSQSSTDTPSYSTTTGGAFVCSPGYMSPEQCAGAMLDKRSDIYSLGCVMYEAISGSIPFKHDNVLKTILAHVNDLPQPFAVVRPDLEIPAELERIVLRCLEKNPDDRYQNARELGEDLWAFAASEQDGKRHKLVAQPTSSLGETRDGPLAAGLRSTPTSGELPVLSASQTVANPPLKAEIQRLSSQSGERPALTSAEMPILPPAHGARPAFTSAEMPTLSAASPSPPAAQGMPTSPKTTFSHYYSRTMEPSPLSEKAYHLLRKAGILSDDLLAVVFNCERMVERGEITAEQAVAIMRHFLNQVEKR